MKKREDSIALIYEVYKKNADIEHAIDKMARHVWALMVACEYGFTLSLQKAEKSEEVRNKIYRAIINAGCHNDFHLDNDVAFYHFMQDVVLWVAEDMDALISHKIDKLSFSTKPLKIRGKCIDMRADDSYVVLIDDIEVHTSAYGAGRYLKKMIAHEIINKFDGRRK